MKWRTVFLWGLSVVCCIQLLKLGLVVFDEPDADVKIVEDTSHITAGHN